MSRKTLLLAGLVVVAAAMFAAGFAVVLHH
jgi:hypothetical protein